MTGQPLEHLNRLVGSWNTEATHPSMPGLIVHGTAVIEWLEGARFLIQRSVTDHPEFPDSLSILGATQTDRIDDAAPAADAELTMHYFDSRGVFRVYSTSIDEHVWRTWRDAPGFSQRFTGTFIGDDVIEGQSQLCRDDVTWDDDLQITYRRQP